MFGACLLTREATGSTGYMCMRWARVLELPNPGEGGNKYSWTRLERVSMCGECLFDVDRSRMQDRRDPIFLYRRDDLEGRGEIWGCRRCRQKEIRPRDDIVSFRS